MRKYNNHASNRETLLRVFDESHKLHGHVHIITSLDHVSRSGMTRYISAFVLLVDEKGAPYRYCIARECKLVGCGMDMGFELAYRLFCTAYGGTNPDMPYQTKLRHSWL